jgi:uncharacterized iron-regulated membrane protein
MKPGFRPSMTWLHDWSGLVIGWLLLAIALAGTLAVFRPEIGSWTRPEVSRAAVDPVESTQAAIGWLSTHAAKSPDWYLQPANDRSSTTQAIWLNGKEYVTRALDPRTGNPEGIRDTLGGEFFYRFHFELQLPYPWGRILSASAAMLMVLAIITGIVAHRRFFADFFTFRPGKGQRSWLDAHNLLGVAALPFHLLISFTGALTLANLLMPWGMIAGYRGDDAAMRRDLYPAQVSRAATGRPAPLVPIGPLLRQAEQRFGGHIGLVSVDNPGDAAAVISVTSADDDRLQIAHHVISFDGTTGRILAEQVERRPVLSTFNAFYGLHTGRFAGAVSRWLYFISGLMLAGVIGTGLILWTAKRRERRQGWGFALVERLNVGFVGGTPGAFAAFFLANRLLPLDWVGRQMAEVHAVFWTWGAVLLFGAIRRPARGWAELLAFSAAACAAIPIVDIACGTARVDAPGIGVGLIALLLAAGLGHAAWRSRRPKVRAVRRERVAVA